MRIILRSKERTIAEELRDAGYATFFAGKWHLGGEGFLPTDQGFDVNKGGVECGIAEELFQSVQQSAACRTARRASR